ncbi:nucleoside recognition domain-containing protein, partial [Faecalibacterium duncaniae]|uniref:nucleoside recognition domain-containing protein n=1 Tax=Faecalibacterium duncaniae (strain DSM 17677 / JCM 31915 / A2-165) TaxID=411483 RepID=UPI002941695D
PIIVTLFFFLSLLEDTGYMARVAFVMDKLLRRIGLSGRSIVPGKYTAIPAFVGIMALVFYLTFGVIGAGLQSLLELGIENLTIL